ncbi:MAG: hypothetical protein FJX56_08730 [Alphaproteobacteria bacterium]|nr:hypothetical protein [Alphaproteobacteria bacterium]
MALGRREEQAALTARFRDALRAEERASENRGPLVAAVVLGLIGAWLFVENRFPDVLYYQALLLGFFVLFVGPWLLSAAGYKLTWGRYLLPPLIAGLLTFSIYYPNPYSEA